MRRDHHQLTHAHDCEREPPLVSTLITRLSRVIYRYVDEDELDMTMKQYAMLNHLRDFDGITQGKLGEAIGLDANARGDRAVEGVTEDVFAALDAEERATLAALLAKTIGAGALAVTADG